MYQPPRNMNARNAKTAFADGLLAIKGGQVLIDFTNLVDVDSTAVAILVAWQRAARGAGKTLQIHNAPPKLQSLLGLYGASDLLHDTQAAGTYGNLTQY